MLFQRVGGLSLVLISIVLAQIKMAKKSVRETNDREEIESLEKQTDKVIYILLDTLFIPPHYKFSKYIGQRKA